ncbi:hypothetical protein ACIBCR_15095 [Micromonospora echinospora]|uniref:hypothetical protein n=1 Tax=Micromonospora echinospora TaxID=1877 RepID=UPI0037903000
MTTVYDVGDTITAVLRLNTPVDSADVSVEWTRPDGTTVPDGTPSGSSNEYVSTVAADAAGDWLAVWTIAGSVQDVTAQVFPVRALPSASPSRPAWTPFLSQVADHVPYLTVDTITPGSATHLGTFTARTWPTDEQAQRLTDGAVTWVRSAVGTVAPAVYDMATQVAALRAAAAIARAYPRDDGDLAAAAALDARADADLIRLKAANDAAGGGDGSEVHLLPVYSFPAPVPWGDDYL